VTGLLNGFVGRAAMRGFITLKALTTPVAFGVSALALNRGGKVLLVRHSYQPGWMLPGGGVGRAEPPTDAVLRELREEVGLTRSRAPEFFSLYTRKAGWATNMVAVYLVEDVEIDFRPNFEVVEVRFADPLDLPSGTTSPTARRISVMLGSRPRPSFW
jgi:8-oxo-dGTP pyrophosphatase MutT (NUDIX family)